MPGGRKDVGQGLWAGRCRIPGPRTFQKRLHIWSSKRSNVTRILGLPPAPRRAAPPTYLRSRELDPSPGHPRHHLPPSQPLPRGPGPAKLHSRLPNFPLPNSPGSRFFHS